MFTERLPMPDGDVVLDPAFLPPEQARELFEALERTLTWRHEKVFVFGREILQPRLIAWHGDPGCSYTYSGLTLHPEPWTPELRTLRERVRERRGVREARINLSFRQVVPTRG